MRYSYRRDTCRICGSRDVPLAVPLEPLPITSPNVGLEGGLADDANMRQTVPLDLHRCAACGHLQLMSMIDPGVQYNNFRYVTAISLGLTEHFAAMVEAVSKLAPDPATARVVEIGSNDGTVLRFFQQRGMQVLGVDPARATAEAATRAGIPTLPEFFDAALAMRIRAEFGAADIVIANNTLANIDDLGSVADGIRTLLAPGGVFVFETSYGADVVRKILLDTVYHEHISYFMARPLQVYFARHGLELFDLQAIATKGGSIRGFVQLAGAPRARMPGVEAMIAAEAADGLDGPAPYEAMARSIAALKAELATRLAPYRAMGRPIAAYGASVGTITLIQQFGLGGLLDAVFDDAPLQDHILGPDYRIPILRSEKIQEIDPACILLLAWRYADPIMRRHRRYLEAGGTFILPMPKVEVIRADGRVPPGQAFA